MLSGSSTFYECHALFGTRGMCHVNKEIEGVMPYSVLFGTRGTYHVHKWIEGENSEKRLKGLKQSLQTSQNEL